MAHTDRGEKRRAGDGEHASIFQRLASLLRREDNTAAILESIEEVVEESERENATLSAQERIMLANLLRFGELRIGDVMVPRADIVAVEESVSLKELAARFREAQHSRLPVYRETLDDPQGVVHIKDVLSLLEERPDGSLGWPDVPIAKIRRELLFVPASMRARDLLFKMQTTHIHLALVIDEYGGTDGLVSIEDLIEQIVGEIDDEHDVEETPQVRKTADGSFETSARIDLEDLKEQTGIDLSPSSEDEEVDTLGGLIASLIGRLPQRGEIVSHPSGCEFEILEADPRRIKRVRIRRTSTQKSAAGRSA